MNDREVRLTPLAEDGLAEDGLATAYLAAVGRNELTAAWDRLERRLERLDRESAGPAPEGVRSVTGGPLRVPIEVDESSRTVLVTSVRLLEPFARGQQHGSNGPPA